MNKPDPNELLLQMIYKVLKNKYDGGHTPDHLRENPNSETDALKAEYSKLLTQPEPAQHLIPQLPRVHNG